MEKFENILVLLDGSECAEMILPKVEKLAKHLKASIHLLQVVHAHTFPGVDRTETEVAVIRKAEEYLKKMEDQLKAKGFNVDSRVRYEGDEAEEILDHASRKDVDLIAMTTHGRSGIKRFLLGSVAEKILRHSAKPVFLVRCHPCPR